MSSLFSPCDWVGSERFCRPYFRLAIGSALVAQQGDAEAEWHSAPREVAAGQKAEEEVISVVLAILCRCLGDLVPDVLAILYRCPDDFRSMSGEAIRGCGPL
jgi:hypothetical protein